MAHQIEDLAVSGRVSELGDRSNPILLSDDEEEDDLTAGEEGDARKEASTHVSVSHEGLVYRQSPWTYIDSSKDDPAYRKLYEAMRKETTLKYSTNSSIERSFYRKVLDGLDQYTGSWGRVSGASEGNPVRGDGPCANCLTNGSAGRECIVRVGPVVPGGPDCIVSECLACISTREPCSLASRETSIMSKFRPATEPTIVVMPVSDAETEAGTGGDDDEFVFTGHCVAKPAKPTGLRKSARIKRIQRDAKRKAVYDTSEDESSYPRVRARRATRKVTRRVESVSPPPRMATRSTRRATQADAANVAARDEPTGSSCKVIGASQRVTIKTAIENMREMVEVIQGQLSEGDKKKLKGTFHRVERHLSEIAVAAGDDHIASEETHDTALEYLGSFAVNVRKLMTHTKKKVDFFIEDSFVEFDASFQALKQTMCTT